jgi:hypothetical protein
MADLNNDASTDDNTPSKSSSGGILKNKSHFVGHNVACVEEIEDELQEEESSSDDDSFDEEERGFGGRGGFSGGGGGGGGGVKFRSELMSDRHDRVYDDWADVGFFLRYWEIGFAQSKTLTSLRDRLKDIKSHPLNRPGVVVRFLVLEKFNVNKAERRFRHMISWRAQCAALQKDYVPPPELLEQYPGAILKDTDNDDDPIFLSRLGVADLAGLTAKHGSDALLNYDIFRRESTMHGKWQADWSLKAGRPFRDMLIIEDLHNLTSKGVSKVIAAIFGAAELDQTYYPCMTKEIVIIRAPAHFRAAWALAAKRSLPKAIRQKVHVYGTSDYLEKLEKYMSVDSLPPCINPKGKGEVIGGMSPNLDGKVV